MEIIRLSSQESTPPSPLPSAVAIGNFDGLHLGHQRILSFLQHRSQEDALSPQVLTFSPHPGKITGGGRIQLLQTEEQKLKKMEQIGVKSVFLLTFDRKFASLTPEAFIRSVLIQRLNTHVIIVGKNFRFGKNRTGDTTLLHQLARKYALSVYAVPSLEKDGVRVSSSTIRDLIRQGQVEKASTLLGSLYEIQGRVVPGRNLGRGLGYPTANLDSPNEVLPQGVYITSVSISDLRLASVTNVGVRPTFQHNQIGIETHILDFAQDIYRRDILLFFHKKIRDEERFKSENQLKARISKDIAAARRYFTLHPILGG
jgi:riboflavin kinase/FMN adenylyltransferase